MLLPLPPTFQHGKFPSNHALIPCGICTKRISSCSGQDELCITVCLIWGNNTEIIFDMNEFEAAEMHVMDEGYELSEKQPDSFIEGYDYGFGKGKGKGTAKNGR